MKNTLCHLGIKPHNIGTKHRSPDSSLSSVKLDLDTRTGVMSLGQVLFDGRNVAPALFKSLQRGLTYLLLDLSR